MRREREEQCDPAGREAACGRDGVPRETREQTARLLPLKRRESSVAGWTASSPKRAQRYGSWGRPSHGVRRKSAARVSQWPVKGATSLR